MENLEKCLKIKARLKELTARGAELDGRIWEREKNRDLAIQAKTQEKVSRTDREAAVNALLGGKAPDLSRLGNVMASETEKIKAMKKEANELKAAISLLEEELRIMRGAVMAEIREKYFGPYSQAARTLDKKIDEAAGAEKEIMKIWSEAQALFTGAGFPACSALMNFTRICFENDAMIEASHPIRLFRREAKQEGIVLG